MSTTLAFMWEVQKWMGIGDIISNSTPLWVHVAVTLASAVSPSDDNHIHMHRIFNIEFSSKVVT